MFRIFNQSRRVQWWVAPIRRGGFLSVRFAEARTKTALCVPPLVLALIAIGCASTEPKPVSTPVEAAWEAPVPAVVSTEPKPVDEHLSAEAPASMPAEEAIAFVNGVPIARPAVFNELVHSHGVALLEQMILLTALRQRAAEMGLSVTQKDVEAAYDDALRRLAMPVGNPEAQPLERASAERLLEEFLVAKNISRSEWDRRMEQQAYLRKIAEAEAAKMDITEAMLKEEYALAYGERAQIRLIQASSLSAVSEIRDQLATGKPFELVARERSENQVTAASGGLMPPVTRNDPAVTPLMRETAFGMQVGEVSQAINEGNWYYVIRLERRWPASDIAFEHVDKQALRERLLERIIRQRQTALEAELFAGAVVDIRDPELDRLFRSYHRRTAQ